MGLIASPCAAASCARRGYHHLPPDAATGGDDALPGRMVGKYLVASPLGRGGFGRVYRAIQLPAGKPVALKLLDDVVGPDPEALAVRLRLFEGEARALAALSHPNIVGMLDYGTHDGRPYLAMELVDHGVTLREALRVEDGAALRDAVLPQLLNGLQAAHDAGVVHRDLKPENIMLQRVVGHPRLARILDFGLAKLAGESGASASIVGGSPAYMAPEQAAGGRIGPWSDLFALGLIAFEMTWGRTPYGARGPSEILARKLDPDYDPTYSLRDEGVDGEVVDFFGRALASDPDERFQSVQSFRSALDAISLDDHGSPGPPRPPAEDLAATDLPSSLRTPSAIDVTGPTDAQGVTAPPRDPRWLPLAIVGLLAAVLGVALWLSRGVPLPAAPTPRGVVAAAPIQWVAFPGGTMVFGGNREGLPRTWSLRPFELARTETTVAQYRACVHTGVCTAPREKGRYDTWARPDGSDLPVNAVTYTQAQAFCRWVGGRLPDEAEWELAAAGPGSLRPYPWAAAEPATCARAVMNEGGWGCGKKALAPVCSLPAGNTPEGLCDLAGNVREWVAPLASPEYRPQNASRVSRGGSFGNYGRSLRARSRKVSGQLEIVGGLGFRCARDHRGG